MEPSHLDDLNDAARRFFSLEQSHIVRYKRLNALFQTVGEQTGVALSLKKITEHKNAYNQSLVDAAESLIAKTETAIREISNDVTPTCSVLEFPWCIAVLMYVGFKTNTLVPWLKLSNRHLRFEIATVSRFSPKNRELYKPVSDSVETLEQWILYFEKLFEGQTFEKIFEQPLDSDSVVALFCNGAQIPNGPFDISLVMAEFSDDDSEESEEEFDESEEESEDDSGIDSDEAEETEEDDETEEESAEESCDEEEEDEDDEEEEEENQKKKRKLK